MPTNDSSKAMKRDPVTGSFSHFENFGNYILLKKLATGGMAEVFLARPATHKGNGRVQVIKRILPHAANNPEFNSMFQTEIQVCLGFNHPHTVQIHDFGESHGQPYISMEYIEGKNLKDIICKFTEIGENIPIPMSLSLLSQAASGLHYAHTFVNKVTGEEVRAIHRDISPHNLIVSYDGNLKVIDFGIAKAASSIQDATRAGTIKGKYAYLSPEQISGAPLDARVDVFALGIVAWELLTLRRPFYRTGDTEMTILNTISNCDYNIKAPSYYNGAVSAELDQIVLKALRKDPAERYASAEEFQTAIRQVMQAQCPHYTYGDNGRQLQSMFEKEIAQERSEIRMLNLNVQLSLSNSAIDKSGAEDDGTMVLAPTPSITDLQMQVQSQGQSQAQAQKLLGMDIDLRLLGIEQMMKEKASKRHYVMFAFYLVSVVLIKLDNSFDFLEVFLPQNRVVAAVGTATPLARGPARAAVAVEPRTTAVAVPAQPRKAVAPAAAYATSPRTYVAPTRAYVTPPKAYAAPPRARIASQKPYVAPQARTTDARRTVTSSYHTPARAAAGTASRNVVRPAARTVVTQEPAGD